MTTTETLTQQELLQRMVAVKVTIERLKEIETETKAALIAELGPGSRMKARTADGDDIGTVSVSEGKPRDGKPVVSDMQALTKWLAVEDPAAVRFVAADWWVAALPAWIASHDGELPPGVTMSEPTEGKPYVSVRLSQAQREAIEAYTTAQAVALIEPEEAGE